MKDGLGNLMKQAQKMQEDMQKAQEELKSLEIEGHMKFERCKLMTVY